MLDQILINWIEAIGVGYEDFKEKLILGLWNYISNIDSSINTFKLIKEVDVINEEEFRKKVRK